MVTTTTTDAPVRTASAMPAPEEVERILRGSAYPTLRFLKVRVIDGVVRVSGCVRSYYEKQIAYHAVRHMEGVHQVEDQIDVYDG